LQWPYTDSASIPGAETGGPIEEDSQAMDNKKILVVDDESDMRIFISTVVETGGFKPVSARDGTEALNLARSQPPDLVILDVMMPRIDDGIQTYQQFRTDETLKGIPIIMLSAIARKTFLHTIRMLNPQKGRPLPEPEAYMEKPPEAAELIRIINELIRVEE
jgi:CheY-like chemotaxis protein